MSIRDIKARLHEAIDALPDDVRYSSPANDQAALKECIQALYSGLASYAWHCGADGDVFQREAAPAAELVDDVFFDLNLEREFEAPAFRQPYSTINHSQQGIAR